MSPLRDLADLQGCCCDGDETCWELHCCFKGLTSLDKLTRLTTLRQLNVSFNSLTSLEGIQCLPHLQQLNASHNSLTSIEQVSGLQRLTQLVCSHNKISSTEGLLGLLKLQFLALHNNSISRATHVAALQRLTMLQHLTLRNNPVCKQDGWQQATIAVLPSLQALDSSRITPQQRAAAAACADVWAAAGEQEYSNNSTPRLLSSGGDCSSAGGAAATSRSPSSRRSTGSSGGLRPRVLSGAAQAALDDSIGIKDATSLLPSMSLQPLKPSSLVRRAGATPAPSQYGYSRAKPVQVLQKQTYEGSMRTAVTVSSDGSASLTWPEGSMAASLDPEEPPVAGSIASSSGGTPLGSSSSRGGALALPPIQGYRMLAMYRSIVGVAVSCDSSGGFVQWPNGQLMLVWNKKQGGTAYEPDGRVTQTFTNKRKGPGSLQEDIMAQLDAHLAVTFLSNSHDVQLHFDCEGCSAVLSQRHGTVLPDRAVQVQQRSVPPAAVEPGVLQEQLQRHHAHAPDTLLQSGPHGGDHGALSAAAAAATAGLPGGDEMQALLARARALMAATDLSSQQDTEDDGAPTAQDTQAASVQVGAGQSQGADSGVPVYTSGAGTGAADEDLQAMMARARAALAGLQGVPG